MPSPAAASGSWAGHLTKGLSRGDIKDLGELLDDGEAGIVVVGVFTPEEGVDRYLGKAAKVLKKQVDADAEEIKKAIDEAVSSVFLIAGGRHPAAGLGSSPCSSCRSPCLSSSFAPLRSSVATPPPCAIVALFVLDPL